MHNAEAKNHPTWSRVHLKSFNARQTIDYPLHNLFKIVCGNNILSHILFSSELWENHDLYLRQKKKSWFSIYPVSSFHSCNFTQLPSSVENAGKKAAAPKRLMEMQPCSTLDMQIRWSLRPRRAPGVSVGVI